MTTVQSINTQANTFENHLAVNGSQAFTRKIARQLFGASISDKLYYGIGNQLTVRGVCHISVVHMTNGSTYIAYGMTPEAIAFYKVIPPQPVFKTIPRG